ncbi:MAG: sugar phosphate isomerase/epimerase family protein [Haloferacaceae archaeon]
MVTTPPRSDLTFRERIGVALGTTTPIREGIEWAAANDVRFLDFRPDERSLDPDDYGPDEVAAIREACEANGVRFGLHSLSGVNVAETVPFVAEGVDEYLRAYVDLAAHLGASWVIVHPGCHFGDREARLTASIERLRRLGRYADDRGVPLVMCNMNPEPPDGEMHYLGADLDGYRRYADGVPADHLEWAFNAPHAHLSDDGIDGFLDGIDVGRIGHVRLNDNRGEVEEHLYPGEGTIDFASLFDRLEGAGFDGHYTLAFGSKADMLEGREYLVERRA